MHWIISVKGDKEIPEGFTDGAAVATLQGQDITFLDLR
jgi:hypothetical protein